MIPINYSPTFVPSIQSIYNNEIEIAIALDFVPLPRMNKKGECEIKLHKRKQVEK